MQRTLLGAAIGAVLFAAFARAQVPPAPVEPEQIDPTFRNCRGINYLATYPQLNGTPGYHGVASSTAMWWYYDTAPGGTWTEVDQQLSWLRKAGINTLRVFLSFPCWEHFENNPQLNVIPGVNDAVRRYQHFLGLCRNHGLWLSPVLWDETLALAAPEPAQGTVVGNLDGWHTNPGESRMQALLLQDPTLVTTRAFEYLQDYALASTADTGFLFWHLMNEPAAPDQLVHDFLAATLGILDGVAPYERTLLLAALADTNAQLSQLARDPRVDLLGIHPYGSTRGAVESQLYDATHFPDPTQPGGVVHKPVIATEIGAPGAGWCYADAVRYATGVPRPDLGPTATGVGYMPWVSCIGWNGGNYPFKEGNGLFYGDGQVRERAEVMAFVNAAQAQGVPPSTLWTAAQLVEKPTTDPAYIAQIPIPQDLDSFQDLSALLVQDPTTFTFDAYVRAVVIFTNTGHVTAYLASPTNGNPYGVVGAPYRGSVNEQFLLLQLLPSFGIPVLGPNWPLVVQASENFCGTTFSQTDPCHLWFLGTQVIAPWQSLLGPFVLGQGPY